MKYVNEQEVKSKKNCRTFELQTRFLFVLNPFFSRYTLKEKTVNFSGIGTGIVRVEGKHADHLVITAAAL